MIVGSLETYEERVIDSLDEGTGIQAFMRRCWLDTRWKMIELLVGIDFSVKVLRSCDLMERRIPKNNGSAGLRDAVNPG